MKNLLRITSSNPDAPFEQRSVLGEDIAQARTIEDAQLLEGDEFEQDTLDAHDWSTSLALVEEACDRLRRAEQRVEQAEAYSQSLTAFYEEQIQTLTAQKIAVEERAAAAELRAAHVEMWLVRFHDAILKGFGRTIGATDGLKPPGRGGQTV